MSISDSIIKILNVEKQKMYMEDVGNLFQNYTKFRFLTLISKKLRGENPQIGELGETDEFKQILEITIDSKIDEINKANKNLAQLTVELYSHTNSYIENTISFYTLVSDLNLDAESSKKSSIIIQVLKKITQLNKKIISGKELNEEAIKEDISSLVTVLEENMINIKTSDEDNIIYNFLNLYQEKSSEGSVLYLNDIEDITELQISKLSEHLYLQIHKK